jgi:NAD-dependent SIR2 family protein deacetylase
MPTKFHKLLDSYSDRVIHLTQNIDGLEDKLPSLPHKTHRLHGGVDTLVCELHSMHIFPVAPEDFEKMVRSRCPKCIEADWIRVANGKRSQRVGTLLPNILLYGTVKEDVIEKKLLDDMFGKVDAVIIAGTRLKCKSAKILARELCRAARWNNGFTVWVNQQEPDSNFRPELDFVWDGDCDEFASACSVQDL